MLGMTEKISKSDFRISLNEFLKHLVFPRKLLFYALVVFTANFVIKALFVSDGSFWYDEIFSVFHSQKPFRNITHVSKWDVAPPFYYYLLHVWMKFFGMSEVSVRMLSVLFSSFAGAALFAFTYKHYNKDTSVLVSVLYISSNILFFYSQEARTYSLLVLFSVVSSYAFFELYQRPNLMIAILLGVINWAAIFSQYIFVIIPLIQGVFILIHFRRKPFVFYIISGIISLLIFNKWLFRVYDIFASGGNSTINASINLKSIWNMLVILLNGKELAYALTLLLVVGIAYFIKTVKSNTQQNTKYSITYAVLWGIGTFVLMIFFGSRSSLFIPRYMLVTLIGVFIFIAYFVSFIRVNTYIKIAVYVVVLIAGLFQINYRVDKGMDYKNALVYIKEIKQPNTLIILQTIDMGSLFAYYYNIDVFKQYSNLEGALKDENVLMFNNAENVTAELLNGFDQVIHVQTFEEFTDPSGTLETFLKGNMSLVSKNTTFSGVTISQYNSEMN